ncbi:MAG: bifunctional hydroxymethylpyrimidine kinase/phosphomethylpyrimidine kinase, partial [Anaerolineae bacterium]|nr:bifunctional hydroxymethylpyrimidine kinase/phosphomethylpyrimidine kinase [Anaerolineae bacterium]
ALTIAGSDSGGGAGIQADLKTFAALGVFGMSVLTAITAQNTHGVLGVHELPPDFVGLQMEAVLGDLGADAVKLGMLSSAPIIEVVAHRLRQYRVERLVVDPVMMAKGGDPLLRTDARDSLIRDIIPLAYVVTPNLPEAETLVGFPVRDLADMERAARAIYAQGARNVVVKGGHLNDAESIDLLFDGQTVTPFHADRVQTRNNHGTGCTFASAIAAGLARGLPVPQAVAQAKDYLTRVLRTSAGLHLGQGTHGPMNHMALVVGEGTGEGSSSSLDTAGILSTM